MSLLRVSGVALCLLVANRVLASEEALRFTTGTSECPLPERVEDEVLAIVPAEKHGLFGQGVRVEVKDLGDSFRIEIEKDGVDVGEKDYADPERDCDKRGRFAAVFAALTLMPPELQKDPLREQYHAQASVPVPEREPEPPPKPDLARIELSGVFEWSPPILRAPSIVSLGGELRVALGRGVFAGTLAVGYMPPARFDLGELEARIARMPASAGLRVRSSHEAVELSLDLGGLVSLERVEGTSPHAPRQQTVVEIGFRSGALVAYKAGFGVLPFLGLSGAVIPVPHEIATVPQGVVGNTPYVWLAANAGLALSL